MSWSGQTMIFRPLASVLLAMASLPGTAAAAAGLAAGVAAGTAEAAVPSASAQAMESRRMVVSR